MKRWIIRSFFLALLVLSVAAWGWSHFYRSLIHFRHEPNSLGTGVTHGIWLTGWKRNGGGEDGISIENTPHGVSELPGSFPGQPSFLGFYYIFDHYFGFKDIYIVVGMPLWFATSMLSLASIFVWRKTRPKANPKSAFPVEMDKMTT